MSLKDWNGYSVGESSWFEVLDCDGASWHWVHGTIVCLVADPEEAVWGLLQTLAGPRLCRLSGYAIHGEEAEHPPHFAPPAGQRPRRR